MKRIISAVRTRIPAASLAFFIAGALCAVLHLIFTRFPGFADGFNRSVGAAARFLLAKATGWIPFSIAEGAIVLSPFALAFYIVYTVRMTKKGKGTRAVAAFVSLIPLIYALFVITFAAGYYAPGIDEKMGLRRIDVTEDEIMDAAYDIVEKINEACGEVNYSQGSKSVMPYSNGEMIEKLDEEYKRFDANGLFVDFSSTVKQVVLSVPMAYTGITGVYTFFTGEANLNVVCPDVYLPFAAAHEMAHQRGIAREDEANFVAFLVCKGSDDPFIRYSAYFNMLDYFLDALRKNDIGDYLEIYSMLDERITRDYYVFGVTFNQYVASPAAEVSSRINDVFLKSQGTSGVASYSEVVRLFVLYNNSIES